MRCRYVAGLKVAQCATVALIKSAAGIESAGRHPLYLTALQSLTMCMFALFTSCSFACNVDYIHVSLYMSIHGDMICQSTYGIIWSCPHMFAQTHLHVSRHCKSTRIYTQRCALQWLYSWNMWKCHVPNIRSKSLLIIVPLHTLKIQDLDHASDYSRVCIPFVFVFIVYIEWINKNIHIHTHRSWALLIFIICLMFFLQSKTLVGSSCFFCFW